jgi:hypothetical protein
MTSTKINTANPSYNYISLYNARCFMVPINSLLLAISLDSSVITTDKRPEHSSPVIIEFESTQITLVFRERVFRNISFFLSKLRLKSIYFDNTVCKQQTQNCISMYDLRSDVYFLASILTAYFTIHQSKCFSSFVKVNMLTVFNCKTSRALCQINSTPSASFLSM